MKKLILILLTLLSLEVNAQYRGTRQNAPLVRTEDYVTNTPGNSIANSKLIAIYKDSTYMAYNYPAIQFWNFTSSRNDGFPTSILWLDANGYMKRGPLPAWLLTETDPVWTSDKLNYYDKTTSDGRYLQSFIEVDPSVAAWIKAITLSQVSNWDSAYSWGNHASAGYLLSSTAATTYQPLLDYTPYNATNPAGYISSVPAQSFSSLTGKPTTLSGYGITDAYPLTGNPSNFLTSVPAQTWTSITGKPTFATVATSGLYSDLTGTPTIPASQVNSDWNSVSGVSQILNKPSLATVATSGSYNDLTSKPTIPTNTNQLTNGAGFLITEVDGSVTNEIELPSQTGNSGKVLSTNGTSPSWIPLSIQDYYNTVAVAGGSGESVFYLTSDKTSSGTPLYTTIDYVNPIINNASGNYTYGWSYNSGTKALTVTSKVATPTGVIALLGISILGSPVNVANGVNVQVLVKGH